jgi:hypothetical protein
MIKFTQKEAQKLADKLDDLMMMWSPRRDASDYCCAFCHNRPVSAHASIVHEQDCYGHELIEILTRLQSNVKEKK